jgi:hypothetical protein
MNRPWRAIVPLVVLVLFAGCGTMPPGDGGSESSSSPRVRCLTDPARDNQSTSRPMVFLFCVESP